MLRAGDLDAGPLGSLTQSQSQQGDPSRGGRATGAAGKPQPQSSSQGKYGGSAQPAASLPDSLMAQEGAFSCTGEIAYGWCGVCNAVFILS